MTPNEIKAHNIAWGFACGDCAHDKALKQNCEGGCLKLQDDILAALNAKDLKHKRDAGPNPKTPFDEPRRT